MSGNTRGWIGFSVPGEGKIRDIVLSSKKRGGGIRNFVKSRQLPGYHGDLPLSPTHKYTGNIKWRKGEFSDEKTRFRAAEFLQSSGDDSLEDWE